MIKNPQEFITTIQNATDMSDINLIINQEIRKMKELFFGFQVLKKNSYLMILFKNSIIKIPKKLKVLIFGAKSLYFLELKIGNLFQTKLILNYLIIPYKQANIVK